MIDPAFPNVASEVVTLTPPESPPSEIPEKMLIEPLVWSVPELALPIRILPLVDVVLPPLKICTSPPRSSLPVPPRISTSPPTCVPLPP
uniref:Uncharacterized protein n=1 Tax=Globisporangium ultimum (strain ATCC 200006 / CBS 805.95 / DAOM BR144) TaxID=431595 RepID=K3WJ26_GLOUD